MKFIALGSTVFDPVRRPALRSRAGSGNTQAAFFNKFRLIKLSAIYTAFNAAPLRRLSETIHMDKPLSTVESSRMRLTYVA